MKVYIVWYRTENDSEDIVRGAASNWKRAEYMAKQLDFILRLNGITPASVGVKSYVHGNVTHDDDYVMRWCVNPLESEKQ